MKLAPLVSVALGVMAAAVPAAADQLIHIPTADLVTGVKGEYKQRLKGNDEGYGTLLVPAGRAYELMFRYYNNEDHEHNLEGGAQFQLLPDGIITPGLAVGMWDVTNSSRWGRRAFIAVSKSLRPGQLFVRRPLERVQLNFGTGTGRFSGIMAGARLDFPGRISLVGEFDSRRLNAGIWFAPIKPLTLKGELQNGNPYFGGEFRARF